MSGKEESELSGKAAPGSDEENGLDADASAASSGVVRSRMPPDHKRTLSGSGMSPDGSARIPADQPPSSRPTATAFLTAPWLQEWARESSGSTTVAGLGSESVGSGSTHVPAHVPAVPSTHIPFRVGPYEVATRIAQGGMGSIYVCRRAGTTGLFTLKVVRQHLDHERAAVHSFNREARVGALLRHPNAQTVLDKGIYDDQPYLILPYVEGASLGDLLADGARLSPSVVVTILLDVLRALMHAHNLHDEKHQRLGLVHADVSPDNVLIGVDGVARLTDFGSARFVTHGIAGTPEEFGLGKASYMAPEQLRGEELDGRTDIFAVGVMMWTALTGQTLFTAETYDQTVMRVMRRKVPAPSGLGAPACLDDVCLRALSRSPEGRYATADDMADALMTATADTDLVASRAVVAQLVRREVGELLSERRRRIDMMFRDVVNTPAPVTKPRGPQPGLGLPRPHLSTATVQMEAVSLPPRTVFIPAPGNRLRRSKTTLRQWYLIVSVSIAVFFATLVIASLALKPAPRPTPPPTSSGEPLPAPPTPTDTLGR